jgi:hypothetical protein
VVDAKPYLEMTERELAEYILKTEYHGAYLPSATRVLCERLLKMPIDLEPAPKPS